MTGGGTPAALAADWLTSVYDNNTFAWESSPLGTRLEEISIDWLKELFGLPSSWGGVLTTGATMANFTGLAAARRWWAERHGRDVDGVGPAATQVRMSVGGAWNPGRGASIGGASRFP